MIDWEGRYNRILRLIPYPLLVIATTVSLIQSKWSTTDRLLTLGYAVIAFGWIYFMFTRAPRPAPTLNTPVGSAKEASSAEGLERSWRLRIYFAGFLAIAVFLVARDMPFFIFVIGGFFHAFMLRPWPVGVAGVLASSLIINLGTIGLPTNTQEFGLLAIVVLIQTTAIGGGVPYSEKIAAQQEKRLQTMRKLEEALDENAGLQAQLLIQAREAGILDERQRMAREIHDTLAQGLTGIVTQLEAANQAQEDPEAHRRHLDNAARLARDSLREARRTVHAIRPEQLETSRLPEAISDVATKWSALHETQAELTITGTPSGLHPAVEVTLLRVTQEALSNVAKHAAASRVGLTLSYMEDVVTLDVRDDGSGFSPGDLNGDGGFGLTGMRQRVRRLAGRLEVESEPGAGTAIFASVPAIPKEAS